MPSIRALSVLFVVCGLVVVGGSAVAAAPTDANSCTETHCQLAVNDTDANRTEPISSTVERAPGHLPPSEALDAATPNRTIQSDDWLVLTVDVGNVLETVDDSTVLAASENGTDHVTLSLVQSNPPPSLQAHEIPVANLTRRVDTANGTLTYFYDGQAPSLRSDDPRYRVTLTVGAANEHVDRRHTVGTTIRLQSPDLEIGGERLNDDPRSREVLPNRSNVTVPLAGAFSPDKPLDVHLVDGNGTALAPARTVTLTADGRVPTTFDLSAVANGTNATIVVSDGHTGREIATKRIVVGQIADPEIRDISQHRLLPINGTGRVTVAVDNEGTAAFAGTVSATFAGRVYNETVQLPPAGATNVTFALQTPPRATRNADFRVAVGPSSDYQGLAVGGPTVELVSVDNETTGDIVVSPARDRPLNLSLALSNPSVWEAKTTVMATLGDETVRQRVTVPADETVQTTLAVPLADLPTGSHQLTVRTDNDTVTRSLAVTSETPSPTATPTEERQTPGEDGPGFGVVAALLALLSAAWYRT